MPAVTLSTPLGYRLDHETGSRNRSRYNVSKFTNPVNTRRETSWVFTNYKTIRLEISGIKIKQLNPTSRERESL